MPSSECVRTLSACSLFFFICSAATLHAVESKYPEGVALGFPELTLSGGKQIADGKFEQWIEGGKIHVKIQSSFRDGRTTEERLTLQQEPELKQESWSWREMKGEQLIRDFEVDFNSKQAKAVKFETEKGENPKKEEWNEKLDDIVPGQSFAGIGMSFAVKNLMPRLLKGEHVTLKAVAFTTKPRVTDIQIYHSAEEVIPVATQKTPAHHIVMHPKVPAIAKLFVKIKDLHLWISKTNTPATLRFEGPLQEPDDPVVRLNIYPPTTTRNK